MPEFENAYAELGAAVSAEVAAQQAGSENFQKVLQEKQDQSAAAINSMLAGFTTRKPQFELTDDEKLIIGIMRSQPRLIPWLKATIQAKVDQINAALDQLLDTAPTPDP